MLCRNAQIEMDPELAMCVLNITPYCKAVYQHSDCDSENRSYVGCFIANTFIRGVKAKPVQDVLGISSRFYRYV